MVIINVICIKQWNYLSQNCIGVGKSLMGSFSWKLTKKQTQGVLLKISVFSYTSKAVGKSQEVLCWLMQKYVKWWNTTGNWSYFPHHLHAAQCSWCASHLILESGGTVTLSVSMGSLMLGLGLGCCSWPSACTTSTWYLGIPSPQLCQCFWDGKAEMLLSDCCGSF